MKTKYMLTPYLVTYADILEKRSAEKEKAQDRIMSLMALVLGFTFAIVIYHFYFAI